MKTLRATIFLTVVLSFASCSKTLTSFTERMYEEQGWSEQQLEKIQFYLSDDIVLWRDAGNSKSSLENGQIKIVDGRKVEEVVFKSGTPGVFLFSPEKEKFAISFEDRDDRFLMFGPSAKWSGRFVLLAKEWRKSIGKITYDGKVWNTSSESAYATLLVDLKKANNTQYKSKTVSGRKIRQK